MKDIIQYEIFGNEPSIFAFTTLRNFGESYSSDRGSEKADNLMPEKFLLSELLDLNPQNLIFPVQEHTDKIYIIDDFPSIEPEGVDALISNRSGICLCIKTADCVPILLYDPTVKAIGAVHAGWRGTADNIAGKSVELMMEKYNAVPTRIKAVIGPSIGPDVYEVGKEVVDKIENMIPDALDYLKFREKGKFLLNLWGLNKMLLQKTGIISENIEVFGECTWIEKDKYFSARREGISTGRMISGIMIKKT